MNINLRDDLNVVDFPVGFAVRSGDVFNLEKWDGSYSLNLPTYAVALFLAPPLSELNVPISNISTPTGVVVAGLTKDGWGWINTETHTKDYLGELLVKQGARVGEWFKLTITYENPLKED
jgi:hypothetical protein